jgi:hypothetical protein
MIRSVHHSPDGPADGGPEQHAQNRAGHEPKEGDATRVFGPEVINLGSRKLHMVNRCSHNHISRRVTQQQACRFRNTNTVKGGSASVNMVLAEKISSLTKALHIHDATRHRHGGQGSSVTEAIASRVTSHRSMISSGVTLKGGIRTITLPRGRNITPRRRVSMVTRWPIRTAAG